MTARTPRKARAKGPSFDRNPLGPELARRVAQLLDDGGLVLHHHYAHGLFKRGPEYRYELLKVNEEDSVSVFATEDRERFEQWLGEQSAASFHEVASRRCSDYSPEHDAINLATIEASLAARSGVTDTTPYGQHLAESVADFLEKKGSIAYKHRDWCGMGFFFEENRYVYNSVCDGYNIPPALLDFSSRQAFVDWLAAQSDRLFEGRDSRPFYWGNQRITRERLLAVLENDDPEA